MQTYPSYPVNIGIVDKKNVTITLYTNDDDFIAAAKANIHPNMERTWARFQFNRMRRRLAAEGGSEVRYFSADLAVKLNDDRV